MQYDKKLVNGEEFQLALDVRIQDILHDELLNGLQEFHAKAAAGVIIDVTNGEILALSSLPSFDPNLQHEATQDQRFNRVVNGSYELGSVFKIFTNTQAFEDNLIKMTDVFNVRDPIKYGRFTIKDYHPYKDVMTVEEIFTHSSNIGTVQIAKKIGPENQKDFLGKLGLLKRLNTEFPGLGRPIYPKSWRDINMFTISYGHGIAITPLHLAIAGAAVVNGGILYNPSFLKLKEQPSGTRVIKESTSATMRLLLRKTALEGTGRNADIEGYEVGGKTGTSNVVQGGGYNETQTMSSFVAAFPISKPKYLLYVIFDRSDVAFNTGGMVAAPVAGRIVKNISPLLGIRPIGECDSATNLYCKPATK
jgi:cell division protein FtsI (penicillin-binding protein 3)